MKTRTDHSLLTVVAALVLLGACRKDVADHSYILRPLRTSPVRDSSNHLPVVLITDSQALPPVVLPKAPMPQQSAPANSCPVLPIYGDTIVYSQPSHNGNYIINPVNNPGTGTYLSWPVGLALDPSSGAIDLTASETGLKYVVGFVPGGTNDTCLTTLTLGGASYADSVYVLDNNKKVSPYFDGDLNGSNPCQNGNECNFDITGSASAMGVVIEKNSGKLDLEKTLKGTSHISGIFGPLPVNGQTVTADLYYQIADDPSNNAVQHLAIQFVYYDSKSLVNASLLNMISLKFDNLMRGSEISTSFNPKPPLVVIVRHN